MKQLLALIFITLAYNAFSQSNNEPSDYSPHDLKITGYFQLQYQKAAESGISSFTGGDFTQNNDNRFIIRRGRFKFDRVDEFTNIVLQVDATQDGVSLRDGFIQLKDPLFNTFTLTAGQFTKPFGYILAYSSAIREFPERPRVYQTLLPSERDLGVMLSIHPAQYKFIDYQIGLFNGSGTNARDYDNKKDLSTSLNFNFKNVAEVFDIGFGGSYYSGSVRQNTTTVFNEGYLAGKPGLIAQTSPENEGAYAIRRYKGLNLQLNYNSSWGKTSLKSEYITGRQPGVAPSSDIKATQASRSFSTQPKTDLYNRNFNGFFIWLTQAIPKTQLELIASYDVYDPNTFIKEKDIGATGNNTSAADIKYETFGAGLVYYMSKQVKFTLYYDHPINEKTLVETYQNDINDDVFTARLQYRF